MQLSESEKTQSNPSKVPDLLSPELPPEAPEAMDHRPSPSSRRISNQGFAPVLRNPRFLILWGGQIFSQLADKFYLVLMVALIESHFKAANQSISGWVSAIMITYTIPAVLFGLLAGVYVDRWSKKVVLVISNLLRGCLVLSIPFLFWLFQKQTWWLDLPTGFLILLAVTFLVSTLTQFFAPAEQAALPLLVKRRHLLPAISLTTTTIMVVFVIGFAIGELFLDLADKLMVMAEVSWSDAGKVLVVGGSYVIAGLFLLLLKAGEKQEQRSQETPHVFQDIGDGISYLKKNHRVRNALIQLVILFCILAALPVLAPRMAEMIPGMKARQFGSLLAAGGLGLGIGAVSLGYWGQRFSHTQLSLWGSIGMAVSLIGLSFSNHSLWLSLLMTALLGGFASLVVVPMQTTIQVETPPEMRGKVFGLQNNMVNIALSLPLALAGIAETFFGLKPVLLSLAALALAGGLLTWYISRLGTPKVS